MACSTRPGPAAVLDFIEKATGQRLTQTDWHNIKKMAATDFEKQPSRRILQEHEAASVIASLASSVAGTQGYRNSYDPEAEESWGYMDDEDLDAYCPEARQFNAEVEQMLATVRKEPLTDGTRLVIQALASWSPKRAVARANAMSAGAPVFTEPPVEVAEVALEVSQMADDIWFQSNNWQHGEYEDVALGDMRYGHFAGNNCSIAVDEVNEAIVEDSLAPEGWTVDRVETLHMDPTEDGEGSGVHWANMLTSPDGERWVIDFTARQFGGDVPFPLVAKYEEWLPHVAGRTETMYGSHLEDVTLHHRDGGKEVIG